MITIQNLYKNFGKIRVLDNINTVIEQGKITAIAGPNSSGKTTLIKSILGLVKIEKGEIFVDGSNINNNYLYRNKIGYMPQIGRYPDNLTISDIFKMIKELRGNGKNNPETELIELFEIGEHLKKRSDSISGGTRQKVSAVLAFMFNPEILILDEPTTGLDPVSAARIKDKIISENKKGKTVVIISHIMSEVQELADRLVYLLDGKIHFQDETQKLLELTGESSLERAIAGYVK